MAITNLKPINKTVDNAIDYIINPKKTYNEGDKNFLVSSFECSANNTEIEFLLLQNLAKQVKGDYSKVGGKNILAWHIYQSFSPDDNVKAEQVHQLGKELAARFLQNKYQYVIATHIDKNHLHNHIIFNALSFEDFKKFRTNKNIEYLRLRQISNEICKRNNLSITEYPNKKQNKSIEKSFIEEKFEISKKDKTFKNQLKDDINSVIKNCINFDNFLNRISSLGYDIIDDKNGLGFKSKEQKYYTRLKSLGNLYSKNKLEEMIKNNKSLSDKLKETQNKEQERKAFSIDDLISPKEILKTRLSWRTKLKYCIDYYIFKSKTFDEFLQGMEEAGYTIKYGKHISFRCKGMDKNIRAKVLGEDYTEEKIKERILLENKILPKVPIIPKEQNIEQKQVKQQISIKKLIDINNNEKYQTELYYKKFVKRYNTDQMIMTDNFMRKNGYTQESLLLSIETLKKEIQLDKKELLNLEKDFETLSKIKQTDKNKQDIEEAYNNLTKLKDKLERRIKNNMINLEEHNIVKENLKTYAKNQNRTIN